MVGAGAALGGGGGGGATAVFLPHAAVKIKSADANIQALALPERNGEIRLFLIVSPSETAFSSDSLPQFDGFAQTGFSLLPWVVSLCLAVPSASIVQICDVRPTFAE